MTHKKIKTWIFTWGIPAIIFLIPWQTRYIFGHEQIAGQNFEFGTLSIYVVQVLIITAVILIGPLHLSKQTQRTAKLGIIALTAALVHSAFAINPLIALNTWIHLSLAFTLYLLLSDFRTCQSTLKTAFLTGLIAPAIIGIHQFLSGGSNPSTLLGLATRSAETLGDSIITISDDRVLRAYGSFPHPNIFAGYLAIAFTVSLRGAKRRGNLAALAIALILLFTFSRAAFLAAVIALAITKWPTKNKEPVTLTASTDHPPKKNKKTTFIIAAILIFAITPAAVNRLNLTDPHESRSISERVQQHQEFPSVISGAALLGHGLGNYTLAIEKIFPSREWWQYQPIHNTWLLAVGEVGILGMILTLLTISSALPRKRSKEATAILATVLILTLFDHYLWSSWAGLTLLVIACMQIKTRPTQDVRSDEPVEPSQDSEMVSER